MNGYAAILFPVFASFFKKESSRSLSLSLLKVMLGVRSFLLSFRLRGSAGRREVFICQSLFLSGATAGSRTIHFCNRQSLIEREKKTINLRVQEYRLNGKLHKLSVHQLHRTPEKKLLCATYYNLSCTKLTFAAQHKACM